MSSEMSKAQQGDDSHYEIGRDTTENDGLSGKISVNNPSNQQLKCSVCQSSFRRPEHLKRHIRSHTKEKPFQCTRCGRHFSRTDTLHRHEISHHGPGMGDGFDQVHRITVKTFRACLKCAAARTRCSGGTPCVRCRQRSLQCQYPTQRRSKAKGIQEVPHTPVNLDAGESTPSNVSNSVQNLALDTEIRHQSSPQEPFVPSSHGQFQTITFRTRDQQTIDRTQQQSGVHQPNSVDYQTPTSSGTGDSSLYRLPGGSIQGTTSSQGSYAPDIDINHVQTYQYSPIHGVSSPLRRGSSVILGKRILSSSGLDTEDFISSSQAGDAKDKEVLMRQDPRHPNLSTSLGGHWLPTDFFRAMHKEKSVSGLSSQVIHGNFRENATERGMASNNHRIHGNGTDLSKYSQQDQQPKPSIMWPGLSSPSMKEGLNPSFSFPTNTSELNSFSEENFYVPVISRSTYGNIHDAFRRTCRTHNLMFNPFDSDTFPPLHTLNLFLQSYFRLFHPVYPILHQPTFDPNKCHWLLTLAVAALGCHTSDIRETDNYARSFHELVRRIIHVEKETFALNQTTLWFLQASILNFIGLLHSGNKRGKEFALRTFGELVYMVRSEKFLYVPDRLETADCDRIYETEWDSWIEEESKRRVGYCLWLLDCTLVYEFDSRQLMSLDECQAPLPSLETLWEAKDAESWSSLYENVSTKQESLHSAVQVMYVEKRLVSGTGEFSRILLIHALYQRTWEVASYFINPLSSWAPTAKKQSVDSAIPHAPPWLPGHPIYSKWRNSACDCLDILHWMANETIAKAAGSEHPTVLHLHLARIILLVPISELRTLATSLVQETISWNDRYNTAAWHHISRWVKHDQYKARLSVIHAGLVLWHIRRYSSKSFHEPAAIFLATLTLWAYGSCHGSTSPNLRHELPSLPSHQPTFIHLDRPCDDELIQLFVREGHRMKGNMAGVGDICDQYGPEKVLREGCRILSDLASWGVSRTFGIILNSLADRTSCDSAH